MKLKTIFKRIAAHLIPFAAFTAVTLFTLFGLPALADRHPFALLAVSLAVLILTTAVNFKSAKESDKAMQAHRRTVQRTHHKAA